ncbi:hypothetical protein [Roseateles puraquae]|uniref:hypothetical protein n=1 Tax=Roseateles puraquae TaxID=431059 RepID=UPI0031D79B92
MATKTVAGAAACVPANTSPVLSEKLTRARAEALDCASNEITAIAQTLQVARQHKDIDNFDALLPGALMRIELLGTCVGILADHRTDGEEVCAQYGLVKGHDLELDDHE